MDHSQELLFIEVTRLIKSSEEKYKAKDFKGSIDDKLAIRSILKNSFFSNKDNMNMYREELTKVYNLKFDLIKDYKKQIDNLKRNKIIKLLEKKFQEKYLEGDYKGAIKALRRSEKYQWNFPTLLIDMLERYF